MSLGLPPCFVLSEKGFPIYQICVVNECMQPQGFKLGYFCSCLCDSVRWPRFNPEASADIAAFDKEVGWEAAGGSGANGDNDLVIENDAGALMNDKCPITMRMVRAAWPHHVHVCLLARACLHYAMLYTTRRIGILQY